MDDLLERISSLAINGAFGHKKIFKITTKTVANIAPQCASEINFFVVEFEEKSKSVLLPIVSKVQPRRATLRQIQNSDLQFFMEVTMYSKIFPLLGANEGDIFPRLIYGEATYGKDPEKDVIILEDLSSRGFVPARMVYLDADAVKMSLRKLGCFHGLSYRAKKSHNSEPLNLAKCFPQKQFANDFHFMLMACLERGWKVVKARSTLHDDLLDKVLEKIIYHGGPRELLMAMRFPEEPFAAIVHGDFNSNNLMYKYSNGKLVDVKIIDFQGSNYADPSIDLAFFLYTNTTRATRNDHWNEFLQTYWDGLISVEPDPGFSYQEFLRHFGSRAIYGFFTGAFFLPILLDMEGAPIEEFIYWNIDQKVTRLLAVAGTEGDDVVGNILHDLLDKGYLEMFVQNYAPNKGKIMSSIDQLKN